MGRSGSGGKPAPCFFTVSSYNQGIKVLDFAHSNMDGVYGRSKGYFIAAGHRRRIYVAVFRHPLALRSGIDSSENCLGDSSRNLRVRNRGCRSFQQTANTFVTTHQLKLTQCRTTSGKPYRFPRSSFLRGIADICGVRNDNLLSEMPMICYRDKDSVR